MLNQLILLIRKTKERPDYRDLMMDLVHQRPIDFSGYDIEQINSIYSFRDEIAEYIMDHGLDSLFTAGILNEDVIKSGTSEASIVAVLQKFLDKLSIDNELIIVDPYFFARPRNANYETMFCDLVKKYLPDISDIIFITNTTVVTSVKNNIETGLLALKSSLNIIHKTSSNYHDRYWISSSREKGMVMGTSLNGLGNKLALIDRLNTTDVRTIVDELITENLI